MLHVHRSERADALVGPLAAVLAVPPADPFTADVVAVPTRGVERWLAQRLSHLLGASTDPSAGDDGICAHVAFSSPSRLIAGVGSQVLGLDPDDDPWSAERLTWALLEVVDACAGEPWCGPLGRHLGAVGPGDRADGELRRGRRLGVARRLAGLYTAYGQQRPVMLRRWAAGADDDGSGRGVPADLGWQVRLWCRLREHLAVPSPAERLDDVVRLLVDRPDLVDLPERLSVFGPTRLPTDQLTVVHALSRHRDVHLWLPHPSPALWDRIAGRATTGDTDHGDTGHGDDTGEGGDTGAPGRRADRHPVARHALLASMARDVTELQLRLAAPGGTLDTHHPAPPLAGAPTLLTALQERLRRDAPHDAGAPEELPPHRLDPGDRSVEVHACHGRSRQVEVLRELLVGLLAADPTLEPRDVLVMCPDIESVAPLVTAVFGLAPDATSDADRAVHPGQALRVRLADRSLRRTNPHLSLLADLLDLADGRVTASEVLDLAATEPVRRRFRFDDDDLDRLRGWSVAAGVHWGEDQRRRARFGLPDLRQGTWDVALDRILLGAAMAEEDHRFLAAALPLDDVDSTDVDLAGRLGEFVERLTDVLAELTGSRPLRAWLDTLYRALDRLADAAVADAWQAVQARQVLAEVRLAGAGREGIALRLPDVRVLFADRLAGRPTRAGFRTGALTICSLEPMRSVPHRVVCLLGLDDGAFPRTDAADGDDLLLRDPWVGERDRRGEDRQLFLDALAAASEHLVILYSGADERTGALRPPAVPVGELLDALDRAAVAPDGRAVREHVVVRHPLQPVDERNFAPGALHRAGPFSFDAVAHAGALAARGERSGPRPFLSRPLPVLPRDETVDLDDLVAVLEHPVTWFLRRRLQIWLPGESDEVDDRLPLELDGLATWHLGERLLAAFLDGVDERQAVNAEWRRGEVPPKELGRAALHRVSQQVRPVVAAVRQYAPGPAAAVDVAVDLPSGIGLVGTVPGVHGDVVVRSSYSRLGAKHRLRAWVHLLALAAADPDRSWTAVTVGRAPVRRTGASVARLRPPAHPVALQRLEDLVRLRERALREPLPLPVATAHAYARCRHGGESEEQALAAAEREWSDGFERTDAHHVLCWGAGATFRDLLGPPDATERAWWPDDGTRFGTLARRIWNPLLDHEEREFA